VESTPQEEPRELTRPIHTHRWRWIVLGVVVVIILVVTVEAIALLGARSDLADGRDALESAKRAALAGDLDQAGTSLGRAQASFGSAADGLHGPIGTVARAIPWAGNSADAAAAMADAGRLLSTAGAGLVDGLSQLPDGVGSLAPQAGVVPLSRYAALAGAVDAAHDDAAQAAATLAAAPDSFMPRVIARARWDAQAQADRLSSDLDGVASLLQDRKSVV